jgi:vacuolar-type H+-ATPase subunit E/Vma4
VVFTGYDLIEEAIKKKCLSPVKKMIREQKIPWLQTIFRMQVKMLQNAPKDENENKNKLMRLLKAKLR